MAGYTPRNFLSLAVPSVLGLSLIWFLKKRFNSKQASNCILEEIQSSNFDLCTVVSLSQEPSTFKNKTYSEMQLKETETDCNNVTQTPKVKGKIEDMARLCENKNRCYADSNTNGAGADNVQCRSCESQIELTNGMNGLHQKDATTKELYTNGTCTGIEVEKFSNGFIHANNVTKHKDSSCDFVEQESSIESVLDAKVDTSCVRKNIELDAKDQLISDPHIPLCNGNGLSNTYTESSKHVILLAGNMSGPSAHKSSLCNEFSSLSVGTLNGKSILEVSDCEMNKSDECSSTLSVNSDELSLLDTSAEESISRCSTIAESASSMSDIEPSTSPVDYVADDGTEPLSLPIDDTDAGSAEMLESPGATYCDSLEFLQMPFYHEWFCNLNMIDSFFITPTMEYHPTTWSAWWQLNTIYSYIPEMGSNDSGRGASEIQFTLSEDQVVYMVYEFEILPENCGRLIGRLGKHVKYVNKQTNASIMIKKHPCCNDKRLCAITGTESEINAALKLIRKRFPIEVYPSVTLAQINSIPISTLLCPETLKLSLPEGGVFEALLCSTVTAGHFFLQQPTHPTFYQLPPLTNTMNALYGQTETPVLDNPTRGNICAAEIGGGWYRAEIDEVYEDSENCRLKFLDYGGYADVAKTSIRKIKCDFMLIPFQATECYLAGVMPTDEEGWSAEAIAQFEKEAQGQLIQGCIVAYAEDRIPYVNLYKVTGTDSVFINQKLVTDGFARGVPSSAVE